MDAVPLLHELRVQRQYFRILEEVDVAGLQAAHTGLRLVKDKLLAGERTGGNVEPAVLERALHQAHRDTGGQAQEAEPHYSADCSAVGGEGDRVKDETSNCRADRSPHCAIADLFRGLSDDAVDDTAGHAKSCPGDGARDPDCGVVEALYPGCT